VTATAAQPRTVATPAPARHVTSVRPPLPRLITVEMRKLADTRAGRWLLISIALVVAAMVTLVLFGAQKDELTFNAFFGATLLPVGLLLPVVGILSITGEWSQRTALTTFALVPQRSRIVVAKLVAVVAAALTALVVSVACGALGNLIATATGGTGTWKIDLAELGGAALYLVTYALMGAGFGMLLGNAPLSIVAYLILPTAWSTTTALVHPLEGAGRWLDLQQTLVPLMEGTVHGAEWAHLAVSLLVWVVAPIAAGTVRVLRREAA
jgi:hypothetical protein